MLESAISERASRSFINKLRRCVVIAPAHKRAHVVMHHSIQHQARRHHRVHAWAWAVPHRRSRHQTFHALAHGHQGHICTEASM